MLPMQRLGEAHGAAAVVAAPAAVPKAVATEVERHRPRYQSWLRAWGLHVEFLAVVLVALVTAYVLSPQPYVPLGLLVVWLFFNYHRGHELTAPIGVRLQSILYSALVPMTLLAGAVGVAGLPADRVRDSMLVLAVATGVSIGARSLILAVEEPVRVAVVGDWASVATAATRWASAPGIRLVGSVLVADGSEGDDPRTEVFGIPSVVGLDGVRESLRHWEVDLVVVAPGAGVTPEAFRQLTWSLEGSGIAVGVQGILQSVAPHRISAGRLAGGSIVDVREPRPSNAVRLAKYAVDRVGALVLLLLLSPLLLAIALAVRLETPGPALFRQVRVGENGRPFRIYKIRTMVADAEERKSAVENAHELDSVLFKKKQDPRVTRVGAFLRRSSLDELPQLINVLRGEMSLVGPRPFLADEIAEMGEAAARRLAVRPGITGLWQVSGRSELSWRECTELDSYYADNWSLAGDATICLRTVKAVLSRRGAY